MTTTNDIQKQQLEDLFDYSIVIPTSLIQLDCFHKTDLKMYALIKGLSRQKGYCFATNAYIGDIMGMTIRVVQKYLERLKNFGLLECEVNRSGIQTTRKLWMVDDPRKRQNFEEIKNKIKHDLEMTPPHDLPITPPPDHEGTCRYVSNKICNNTTTTTPTPSFDEPQNSKPDSVVVVSSHTQKIKALEKLRLSDATVNRALRFSLEDIENAIECCLKAPETPDCVDAYLISALKEKWKPKTSKEEIQALKQAHDDKNVQLKQKIYIEAKQLEVTYKNRLKEGADFEVRENCVTLKFNDKWSPLPIDSDAIRFLRKYIDENKK